MACGTVKAASRMSAGWQHTLTPTHNTAHNLGFYHRFCTVFRHNMAEPECSKAAPYWENTEIVPLPHILAIRESGRNGVFPVFMLVFLTRDCLYWELQRLCIVLMRGTYKCSVQTPPQATAAVHHLVSHHYIKPCSMIPAHSQAPDRL